MLKFAVIDSVSGCTCQYIQRINMNQPYQGQLDWFGSRAVQVHCSLSTGQKMRHPLTMDSRDSYAGIVLYSSNSLQTREFARAWMVPVPGRILLIFFPFLQLYFSATRACKKPWAVHVLWYCFYCHHPTCVTSHGVHPSQRPQSNFGAVHGTSPRCSAEVLQLWENSLLWQKKGKMTLRNCTSQPPKRCSRKCMVFFMCFGQLLNMKLLLFGSAARHLFQGPRPTSQCHVCQMACFVETCWDPASSTWRHPSPACFWSRKSSWILSCQNWFPASRPLKSSWESGQQFASLPLSTPSCPFGVLDYFLLFQLYSKSRVGRSKWTGTLTSKCFLTRCP